MKGKILIESAYAQGKMLESSKWHGVLPRGITPSDVDLVFDNAGRCILCELKRGSGTWAQVSRGQRMLYESLVRGTEHVAVLAGHSVASDTTVCTHSDVEWYQCMHWTGVRHQISKVFSPGESWRSFVRLWFSDPAYVLQILAKHPYNLVLTPDERSS